MQKSRIFLLRVLRNVSGEMVTLGFTESEEFAIKWWQEDPMYREYEEVESLFKLKGT